MSTWCSLCVVIWRSKQVCSVALLCRCHRYTAYRQLVTLLGKDVLVPLPSCAVRKIEEEYHKTVEDFMKCRSDRVTGRQPWLWSSSYAPWQPVPHLASPFLRQEWMTCAVVPACLLWTRCTAQLPLASGHQCTLKKHNSHFSMSNIT